MKKRILCAIIMSALVLSLTACGTSTDAPEATEGAEVTTTTTATKEEKTEAETESPAETEETTTTEAPADVPKVTGKPTIYNDCMVFEQDGTTYVYNVVDNKMYNIDKGVSSMGAIGKIVATYDGLYNLETNELYDVDLCSSSTLSEYNVVCKIENTFDGTVYNYGIIDKNGEWAKQLSADYEICKTQIPYITHVGSDLIHCNDYMVYNWKNDSMESNEITNGQNEIIDINGRLMLIGKYTDTFSSYSVISVYNTDTKTSTDIPVGSIGLFENHETNNGLFAITGSDDNNYFAILDDNYNTLYSNTEYNVENVPDATEKYAILTVKNGDGNKFITILDNNGNRIIEPIEGTADTACISGDYAIVADPFNRNPEFIVNCTTGEMIDYDYDLYNVNGPAGMAVVESEGAYYLVDPADPETLINPFEIAE